MGGVDGVRVRGGRRQFFGGRIAVVTAIGLMAGVVSSPPVAAASSSPAPPATRYLAPAMDGTAVSVETVSSAQTYNAATATVTTTHPGDLLLAFVGSDSPRTGGNSSTVSGGGLTWTLVGADNRQLGDAEIWSARAAGTLTNAKITAKQKIQSWDEALTVVAFTGATGIGASQTADASTGAPSGTLTTTQPNSWVWAAGDDWLKSIKRTPATGQTVVHSAMDAVGDTYWVQSTTAPTPASGTAVTISDTVPTTDPYNLVLVEVLGSKVTAPSVTAVVPGSGPAAGDDAVTVDGANLTGATEVDFGAAKVTSGIAVAPDGTSLVVQAPPGTAGTVDVRVTTPAGQSAVSTADQYTYTAPASTAYSGAHLVLSPAQAGPNPPHTPQTLTATLTDGSGHPMAGMEVAFGVSGANQASTSVPTNAKGVATFTYAGGSAGTDSVTAHFAAGPDSVTSQPATVTWAAPTAPVAPVSMDPVQGQFFAEPAGATTFVAKPGDAAAFAQSFPDLAFNPPAGVIANDHYPPSPTTHPLTDVTTDVAGDANGVLPAQGNGQQAGVGALASFDAVFTTTLHVSQAGDLSYAVDASDGFLLGIGNGASRVNGDYINPPASNQSAFNAYPLVAVADQPAGGVAVTHPLTIHFPTAGDYPVELDYFSADGAQLSLVLGPSAAVASVPNTPPLNVYVGYQDTVRASNDYTISPLPWYGSPGVTFEGDASAQGPGSDSGGVRFDNVTAAPVTIDKVTVDIPVPNGGTPVHYDQWPAGMVVPPGQTLILAENAGYPSFDTSDDDPGTCGVVQNLVPLINVTIGGVTSVYKDTGEVLNTGGFDQACIGNESEPWARIGTTGPANPQLPPPRTGAAAAWDPDTNAFVLFSGYNLAEAGTYYGDTWIWQKGKWTPIATPTAPAARGWAGGAYDKATKSFVVFGGYNTQTGISYNDTWTFDGHTWTQKTPAHSPPPSNLGSAKMVYDDATGTVVLVTAQSQGTQNPDTWTWDGTDWTEHPGAAQPSARWQPSLAYDADLGKVVLFGGSAGYGGADMSDTWTFDGSSWTQLNPAATPSARTGATLDYVPSAGGLVLFGGDQGSAETWLFSNGTWTQQHPATSPPGRAYAASVYDPVDAAEIVAFGAQNGTLSQPLGDLWFLSNGNWSSTLPSAAGPALPPGTSLAISPGLNQSYAAGLPHTFTVSAVGSNGQPLSGLAVHVQITGANPNTAAVATDGSGKATFTDTGAASGADQIQATAAVGTMSITSNTVNVTWTAPASGPPPAISATQPADGAVVRAPVPVTANLTAPAGQSIASWSVTAQSSAPGSPPLTLASGTGIPPATLATFDPTDLANGQYNLVITATTSGGGVQIETSAVSVAGTMKLGAYQATYHELTVPVDGLSMTVDRVYDSTDHSSGDFGTGWHVAVSNFQVGTGRALGAGGWQQYVTSCGILSCDYGYSTPSVAHAVTVTWPDGHQEVFDFTPTGSEFGGLQFINPGYTPRAGTNTVDTLTSGGSLVFGDDGNLYNSSLAQVSDGTVYNPAQFTLTAQDGTVYQLDTTLGLVSETAPGGTSITVDGNGAHGSNGQSITFTRDPAHNNRITQIAGPEDGVNGENQHWTYGYNSAGQLSSVTDPVTTVNYAYDPTTGELLKSTDANNQPLTTITYGPDGRVTSVAQGSNPPTLVTTSAAARSQTTADPNGKLTTTELFDTAGDLVEKDQTSGTTTLKTLYTYDSSGRLTSTTDPTGAATSTSYDESPGAATNGDVLSRTDGDGRTTTYAAYNQFGQPGETFNQDGSVARVVTFDATTGQPLTSDVPGLAPTTYTYNPNSSLASLTDPAGRTTHFTYDASGNLTAQTDGAGHAIHSVEGSDGKTASQTDASSHETDYAYDGNGNLTAVTTAATHASQTATYNGFDRPLTVTDQDGKTTAYVYDTNGNITKRTNPDGVVTTYTYDSDGNLTAEASPTGTTHYAYSPLGQLVETDNANAEVDFTYDAAGRLLTQTTCASAPSQTSCPTGATTIKHAVDPAGLITATDTPAGHTAYAYDGDGRLSVVTDPSGGLFADSYDAAGRMTSQVQPNGAVDTTTFNDADQPLTLTTTNRAGTPLASATDAIDPVTGQITSMNDLNGSNTYTYNPDGTLATATHPAASALPNESYTYDAAGNRLTGTTTGATSTYDAANRLLSDGSNTYTWNGEGDLATKTDTATNATTTYTWDANNRLTATSLSTGGGTTEKYDPLGRLVSETSGTQTTKYLWDGQTLIQQSTGTSVADVVSNPTSGDPAQPPATALETITGSSATYPIYNPHGDPIGASTSQGTLSGPLTEYSSFGRPNAAPAGTGAGGAATFDGYHTSATGEDASTARYYDPATGRFLSPDPKAALNAYSYTANNPINQLDPTGAEELVEYFATLSPSLLKAGNCLAKASQQSPAASFLCLAGPSAQFGYNSDTGAIRAGIQFNPGFYGTGRILKQINTIVQAAIPAAQLKADAETSPLSASVVGFVELFFGYDDPTS